MSSKFLDTGKSLLISAVALRPQSCGMTRPRKANGETDKYWQCMIL